MTANHEHTPTTEQVRELYEVDEWGVSHDEYRAEFDRWLAERDARIEAAAEQRGAIRALKRFNLFVERVAEHSALIGTETAQQAKHIVKYIDQGLDRTDQMEGDE